MVAVTVHSVEIHSGIVEEDEGHVSLVLSEAVQHRSVSVVVLHIPVNPRVSTEQLQTAESLLEINPAFSVYYRTFPGMEAKYNTGNPGMDTLLSNGHTPVQAGQASVQPQSKYLRN